MAARTPRRIVLDQWQRWWVDVLWLAIRLHRVGEELIRLASDVQGPLSSRSPGSGPDVARPTELAAITHVAVRCPRCSLAGAEYLYDRAAGRCPQCQTPVPPEDLVAVWLSDLFQRTADLRYQVAGIERLLDLIEHRGDGRTGRQSSVQGSCLACHRDVAGVGEDRLRSGLCPACRMSKTRWSEGRADPSVSAYLAQLQRRPAAHGRCPRPVCRQPLDGSRWCPQCGCEVAEDVAG